MNISIEDITRFLQSTGIQIIIGVINFRLNQNNPNCKKQIRDLTNIYWHQKFCDLKENIDKIESINVFKILDENTKGGNLSAGDIYVGTENGVYLIYGENKVDKFNNLNFPITSIKLDNNGSVYVTNNQEEIYHLNLIGWDSKKLENIKSSNFEKEIKIYYNNDKSSKEIKYYWYNNNFYHNTLVKTFNLGKINPVDNFKKIEFLGKKDDFKKTKVSWGNEPYYPNYYLNHFNGSSISQYIKNKKINSDYDSNEILDYFKITLQPYATRWWNSAWIDIYQGIGITFYWENNNWYLQLLTSQYGHSSGSTSGGTCFINLGSGIRLYNN